MPGPSPLHQPIFTAEQVAQAELVARQRKAPHSHVQRARLALLLHKEPNLENTALALRMGKPILWVRQWRKRWALEGFSLEDKKGRGRKPFFSPHWSKPQSKRLPVNCRDNTDNLSRAPPFRIWCGASSKSQPSVR